MSVRISKNTLLISTVHAASKPESFIHKKYETKLQKETFQERYTKTTFTGHNGFGRRSTDSSNYFTRFYICYVL